MVLGIHHLERWLSGRVLDSRPKGPGFEPQWRHCVVSLSKNINPSLVLVQPRKTRPFITERLLMGRKESNQTNKQTISKVAFIMSFSLRQELHPLYYHYELSICDLIIHLFHTSFIPSILLYQYLNTNLYNIQNMRFFCC